MALFKKIISVMVILLSLNFRIDSAQAAPRNLLDEFNIALKLLDVKKAESLLQEGLVVSDAIESIIRALAHLDHNSPIEKQEKYLDMIKHVQKFGGVFSKSNKFKKVIFSQDFPIVIFGGCIKNWDGSRVFRGKDIYSFLCYDNKFLGKRIDIDLTDLLILGIKKLMVLRDQGITVSKDNSSDGIVASVLSDALATSFLESAVLKTADVLNFLEEKLDSPTRTVSNKSYIDDSDIQRLKMIFKLLEKLGVNPGPKERPFWKPLGKKTPWEILADYRKEHRNEPELLERSKEIEKILPPPEI